MNHVLFPAICFALLVFFVPELAWAADSNQGTSSGLGWLYARMFGEGLITALTPCVYPMIPIVVGVFGARDERVSKAKAMLLATVFVLGICTLYSTLGVVFGILGKASGFGSLLAKPAVVIPLVAFYLLLALWMLGVFELDLPQGFKSKLNRVGGKGYRGAYGLGLVAGLTAAPCTGPFLADVLITVGKTAAGGSTAEAAVFGFSTLFAYGLGLGLLFWIVAVFSVSLPKSGRWMEWVKSVAGIAILAVAVYFLRPLFPGLTDAFGRSPALLGVSVALVIVGVAMGAVHLSYHGSVSARIRKLAGVVVAVVGISGGVHWLLTPDRHLPWETDEQTAFAKAKAEGKGVMIDFSATWCLPCKELEITFSQSAVYDGITKNFVPLKFDVTHGTDADDELQERYGASNLPAVIFLRVDQVDPSALHTGHGIELARVNKYLDEGQFLKVLKPAIEALKGPAPVAARTSATGGSGGDAQPVSH